MNKLKASWQWVVGIVGAIVGLIMLRNFFQKDLKADAKTAETKLKSAVIDTKLESNVTSQEELKDASKALTEGLKDTLKTQDKMSAEEAEAFWSKRGK